MKIRIFFYVFLLFTIGTFFWWIYSLISLNFNNSNQRLKSLRYEVHIAESKLYRYGNNPIYAAGQITFNLRTFKINISEEVYQLITDQHPDLAFNLEQGELEIQPRPEVIAKIENETRTRLITYIVQGLIFLCLLVIGYLWIYRSLLRIIGLKQQQSTFLLSITHELKTPIAALKLFLQTLIKRELSPEQLKRFAYNGVKDTDRLNELVENLLLATRIESGTYRYLQTEQDLSLMLKDIFGLYGRTYSQKYQFKEEITEGVIVKGDEFSLRLAISNLIENAIKYSPAGSEIGVHLKQEDKKAILSISDQGIGIPKTERDKIFRKFYRAGNELSPNTRGTGLGLFIVREVLEKHQALVDVQENSPKGSIFTIKFG